MPLPDWNLEAEEIDDDNDNGDLIMEEDDDMEDEQPLVKFMSHSTKDQRAPSTSKTSRREEWSSYDRSVLKVVCFFSNMSSLPF
ncbi:hypothetical protein AB6A40_007785 [Gnathostoma spinigerum]|uniref:Uncharacterized protein n=1 Tax=Gnathostoma spinigerum TaxID=75299 RepID=A0ABD6EP87_9BILA